MFDLSFCDSFFLHPQFHSLISVMSLKLLERGLNVLRDASNVTLSFCQPWLCVNYSSACDHLFPVCFLDRLLSSIKPGLVKKINRLPTPIAGLVSLLSLLYILYFHWSIFSPEPSRSHSQLLLSPGIRLMSLSCWRMLTCCFCLE